MSITKSSGIVSWTLALSFSLQALENTGYLRFPQSINRKLLRIIIFDNKANPSSLPHHQELFEGFYSTHVWIISRTKCIGIVMKNTQWVDWYCIIVVFNNVLLTPHMLEEDPPHPTQDTPAWRNKEEEHWGGEKLLLVVLMVDMLGYLLLVQGELE